MPVYRYRNLTTNETFDHAQRITEPALTAHPETGDPVKRLIQPVGIAFKGSGFYVNDSRSSAKSNGKSEKGDKADKPDTAKTESGSDSGKTDKSDTADKKVDKKVAKADKPASKSKADSSS